MTEAPFHSTRMGARFYEHTMPELLRQVARLADAVERLAERTPDRQPPAGEPQPQPKETVTTEEQINVDAVRAARLVNVSRAHWLRLVSSGRAPAGVKLGRRRVWDRDSLVSWCAAGCPSAAQYERMQRAARR